MANGLFNLKQVMQGIQQGGWPAQKTPAVEYLVIAGGGAGGGNGGGGGAGGLLSGIDPVPNGQTLLVTVGGGGTGQAYANRGSNTAGSNSVFGSITSTGGGQGGTESNNWGNGTGGGASGGSGGGGGFFSTTTLGGNGVSGQGNAGGTNGGASANGYGGGGGAGTVGLNSSSTTLGGNGGAGISSAISGTVTAYAGGGGGACGSGTAAGTGGVGGGGAGGLSSANATNGTANTGGGGGGASGGTSGSGGSGIVIVSYPDTYAAPIATTGSPTVSTSGSGSISFNGSSYIYTANNTLLQPGTGDFTIEAWVYVVSWPNQALLVEARGGNSSLPWFLSLGTTTSGYPYFYDGTTLFYSNTYFPTATWTHYAVSRTGTTLKLFLNGTQVASGTCATNLTGSSIQSIGGSQFGGLGLNGYVSNFRFIKGTGLYTSSFTPSTTPLTAVSGTSLLLNTVSGASLADSSSSGFVQSVSGTTPTWNASSPFTATGYKNRVYTWTSSGSITF